MAELKVAKPPTRKGKAVVILGAGSSADFGVPTLNGLFKDSKSVAYLKKDKQLLAQLRELFWHPRGRDLESSDRSLSVEDMLTIIREWINHPGLADDLKPSDIVSLKRRLSVLIYHAVYEGKSSTAKHLNPLIEVCRAGLESTTWASFNWDCMFESSFWYSSAPFGNYERVNPYLPVKLAGWTQGPTNQQLLKLHGSINWWRIDGKPTYLRWGAAGPLADKWTKYAAGELGKDCPIILEPSAYKYTDELVTLLQPQWKTFGERLADADYVIVVGYSLPDNDWMARMYLMTAFQVNENARWLVIDPSEETCAKYRRLLGDKRVTIRTMGLAGFNNALHVNLKEALPGFNIPK